MSFLHEFGPTRAISRLEAAAKLLGITLRSAQIDRLPDVALIEPHENPFQSDPYDYINTTCVDRRNFYPPRTDEAGSLVPEWVAAQWDKVDKKT